MPSQVRDSFQIEEPTTQPEISPSLLDPEAVKVILRLKRHGHQAYLVGGCVRDLLLGRAPKDFDVATSAHPGEVKALFSNCRLIGRRFRLAHVYFKGGKVIEVSTFRANPLEVEEEAALAGADEEGAATAVQAEPLEEGEEDFLITHDNVFGTAEQDARRRDFTINGLFYDVAHGKVLDYVHGRRDLEEKLIRTIGDPEIRIREDPVRVLRAVRFACKLDFDIEPRTYAAMEGAVEDLPRCAPARVLEETFRLLRGGIAQPSLKLLRALGALKLLLPPLDDYLAQHGAEGERRFAAFAGALDQRVRSGQPLDDAMLLAALLLPISRAVPPVKDAIPAPSLAEVIEELLARFVQTARLPRRIAERCRAILLAQAVLSGERRRRGSLARFRRHPIFDAALAVFEISVEATGEHREALEAWKSGSVPSLSPAAPALATRRRRRRRRKRGTRAAPAHA
ncbi:MAG TPA: polynucleotide adenylyltransferase PcnB [Myxococcaceae bacterium]|nr:polynucleotide adenylyltransferase PcnB [Myxococcaceae bacterium]